MTFWNTELGQQCVLEGADQPPVFTVRSPKRAERDRELAAIAREERERQRASPADTSTPQSSSTPVPSTRSAASTPTYPTMVTTAPLDTAFKPRAASPFAPTAFFSIAKNATHDSRTRSKARALGPKLKKILALSRAHSDVRFKGMATEYQSVLYGRFERLLEEHAHWHAPIVGRPTGPRVDVEALLHTANYDAPPMQVTRPGTLSLLFDFYAQLFNAEKQLGAKGLTIEQVQMANTTLAFGEFFAFAGDNGICPGLLGERALKRVWLKHKHVRTVRFSHALMFIARRKPSFVDGGKGVTRDEQSEELRAALEKPADMDFDDFLELLLLIALVAFDSGPRARRLNRRIRTPMEKVQMLITFLALRDTRLVRRRIATVGHATEIRLNTSGGGGNRGLAGGGTLGSEPRGMPFATMCIKGDFLVRKTSGMFDGGYDADLLADIRGLPTEAATAAAAHAALLAKPQPRPRLRSPNSAEKRKKKTTKDRALARSASAPGALLLPDPNAARSSREAAARLRDARVAALASKEGVFPLPRHFGGPSMLRQPTMDEEENAALKLLDAREALMAEEEERKKEEERERLHAEARAKKAFAMMDEDGDGVLTQDEIAKYMEMLQGVEDAGGYSDDDDGTVSSIGSAGMGMFHGDVGSDDDSVLGGGRKKKKKNKKRRGDRDAGTTSPTWRGRGGDGVPESTWAVADAEADEQRGALLDLLYRYQFERAEIHWRAFGGTHFDLGVLAVGKIARVRAVVLNTSAFTLDLDAEAVLTSADGRRFPGHRTQLTYPTRPLVPGLRATVEFEAACADDCRGEWVGTLEIRARRSNRAGKPPCVMLRRNLPAKRGGGAFTTVCVMPVYLNVHAEAVEAAEEKVKKIEKKVKTARLWSKLKVSVQSDPEIAKKAQARRVNKGTPLPIKMAESPPSRRRRRRSSTSLAAGSPAAQSFFPGSPTSPSKAGRRGSRASSSPTSFTNTDAETGGNKATTGGAALPLAQRRMLAARKAQHQARLEKGGV